MVDTASLEQWLVRLERLHPNPIDLGLERVASVAINLPLLPVSVPVVTVAGLMKVLKMDHRHRSPPEMTG